MARSRSTEAHEKVLNAALALFAERGIETTSMDAIAQASGVSKATIYNHWADKEALLLEVMLMVNGLDREPEDVDTGDVQRDLTTVLTRKPPDKFDAARNRMTPIADRIFSAASGVRQSVAASCNGTAASVPQENPASRISRGDNCRPISTLKRPWPSCLAPCSTRTSSRKTGTRTRPTSDPVTAQTFWRAHQQFRKDRIEGSRNRRSRAAKTRKSR